MREQRLTANASEIRPTTPASFVARYATFLLRPNLQAAAGTHCWERVLGRACSARDGHDCRPASYPVGDHHHLWEDLTTGELLLTSETYDRDDAVAEAFARAHGLAVTPVGPGPYGNGTWCYLWTRGSATTAPEEPLDWAWAHGQFNGAVKTLVQAVAIAAGAEALIAKHVHMTTVGTSLEVTIGELPDGARFVVTVEALAFPAEVLLRLAKSIVAETLAAGGDGRLQRMMAAANAAPAEVQ